MLERVPSAIRARCRAVENGCIEYETSATDKVRLPRFNNRTVLRWAYEGHINRECITGERTDMKTCDNRYCVNQAHIIVDERAEVILREAPEFIRPLRRMT